MISVRTEVMPNTQEARDKFGYFWGGGDHELSKDEIKALLNGKVVGIEVNAEYVVFLVGAKDGKDNVRNEEVE